MNYQIEGAIVNDQGVKYAIVVVKHDVVKNIHKNEEAKRAYSHIFPDMPIILLGKDRKGNSNYYGPTDLINYLAQVDPNRIPWRRYIITD